MTNTNTKTRFSRIWMTVQGYLLIALLGYMPVNSGCYCNPPPTNYSTTFRFVNRTTFPVDVLSTSVGQFGGFGGQIDLENIQMGSSAFKTYFVPDDRHQLGAPMGTLAGDFRVGLGAGVPLPGDPLINGFSKTFYISGTEAAPVISEIDPSPPAAARMAAPAGRRSRRGT